MLTGDPALKWTTPLLANSHNPAMRPTSPGTCHTYLVSGVVKTKNIGEKRGREGGREGIEETCSQNDVKIPR